MIFLSIFCGVIIIFLAIRYIELRRNHIKEFIMSQECWVNVNDKWKKVNERFIKIENEWIDINSLTPEQKQNIVDKIIR